MTAAEIAALEPKFRAALADLRKQARAIRAQRLLTIQQYRLTKRAGKE